MKLAHNINILKGHTCSRALFLKMCSPSGQMNCSLKTLSHEQVIWRCVRFRIQCLYCAVLNITCNTCVYPILEQGTYTYIHIYITMFRHLWFHFGIMHVPSICLYCDPVNWLAITHLVWAYCFFFQFDEFCQTCQLLWLTWKICDSSFHFLTLQSGKTKSHE